MSLVLNEPTSLVAVTDQCEMVERWAVSCDSIAELREASNRLAAIDEYLNRTSIEGRGRLAVALRRLEMRIGEVLGKPTTWRPGRGKSSVTTDDFSPDQRTDFRSMAEHGDLVEALAGQSTDANPLSRRQVLQAIADAKREIHEEQQISIRARAIEERFQPHDFDPIADAELTRQRGALLRLCREISAMGDPFSVVASHTNYVEQLKNIEPIAEAARQWLESFIAATGDLS
jgi:hypothetical protein